MSVDEPFDWDEANIAHLARHGITPAEAEEVVKSDPIPLGVELRNGGVEADFMLAFTDGRVQRRVGLEGFVDLPSQPVSSEDLRDAKELLPCSGIWVDDASDKSVQSFDQTELRKAS